LILFLVTSPVEAQTIVPGGFISTDTAWDIAGSPYIVQGNLTVQGTDGADGVTTLTIDPGVEIRMAFNTYFYVGGSSGSPGVLIADGNNGPGAPAQIVFTSDSGTPAAGDWQRIFFRATANGSLSLLRNVLIEYAGAGGNAALDLDHNSGNLVVDQVTVQNAANQGIKVTAGTTGSDRFTLTDCSITATASYSLQFTNHASVQGSVSNSTLESVFYAPCPAWSGPATRSTTGVR
jgi:hypothetical protein